MKYLLIAVLAGVLLFSLAARNHQVSATDLGKTDKCPITTPRMSQAKSAAIKAELGKRYGIDPKGYELDHIVPLELSGTNDADNLQLFPWKVAKADDKLENKLHTEVCNGQKTLPQAQQEIKDHKLGETNAGKGL